MNTRRYGDAEVREIFSLASTGDAPGLSLAADTGAVDAGGLTLNELQQIGQEAGIEPARVAQAAASLDARARSAPVKRSFGLPVGLSRVVELPRAITDREWERLISEFRTIFGATGVATSSGGLREWACGDTQISVEPTAHGEQLRLNTTNSLAMVLNVLGVTMGGMALLMWGAVTLADKPVQRALVALGIFGIPSLAAFGTNVIRLPRWKRERERQMDAIAAHAVKLLSES
ncbi:MAG: hypothetical protein ABI852_05130 [Gemmatimonadaceae bacterium]